MVDAKFIFIKYFNLTIHSWKSDLYKILKESETTSNASFVDLHVYKTKEVNEFVESIVNMSRTITVLEHVGLRSAFIATTNITRRLIY